MALTMREITDVMIRRAISVLHGKDYDRNRMMCPCPTCCRWRSENKIDEMYSAPVVQQVERALGKGEVGGS